MLSPRTAEDTRTRVSRSSRRRELVQRRTERLQLLGKTIREVRGDLSQAEFGAQVGTAAHGEPIPQTTISRWELGEVELTMEQVLSIEEAMGLRPGLLAEAAGYVISPIERAKDVESALRSDPNLDPVARPGLVAAYRSAVELSRRLRTGS